MKPLWNPSIKTLVKNFEYIEKNGPCPMQKPTLSRVSYKWYWNFKEIGWFNVTRSKRDGRSHLVSLTDEGKKVLTILKHIDMADYLLCHGCGIPIDSFFRVPNAEWRRVTSEKNDQVFCRPCYEKMKVAKSEVKK